MIARYSRFISRQGVCVAFCTFVFPHISSLFLCLCLSVYLSDCIILIESRCLCVIVACQSFNCDTYFCFPPFTCASTVGIYNIYFCWVSCLFPILLSALCSVVYRGNWRVGTSTGMKRNKRPVGHWLDDKSGNERGPAKLIKSPGDEDGQFSGSFPIYLLHSLRSGFLSISDQAT